ncbi:stage II sporulation protein R [Neobacillus mesonae]|uniref:stage II sporulation protein R n=1 Tax=Neobacillus mesonae TaxID=1193713 RepID=UPI00203A8DB8|nr:stage II sporulation protein R [Neobacillus mesonae]MCM3567186.1 stage II sporulation protein R [Neobacillus mesonae]
MRSKLLVWGYLCVLSLATMLNLYMPKNEAVAKESIVIPGEAIRLRILANSDFEEDQRIKRKVRDAVNAKIELWVKDLTSMEKAREVIKAKLPEIQAIAEKTVQEQGSDQSVKVEFRKVQFPTKLYGQFLYPAGKYQAILITLGKGEGANWWCVLYPPLCFLDFSNGVAVTSEGFEETAAAKENVTGLPVETKNETAEDEQPVTEKKESVSEKENDVAVSEKTAEEKAPKTEESVQQEKEEAPKAAEPVQQKKEVVKEQVQEEPVQKTVSKEQPENEQPLEKAEKNEQTVEEPVEKAEENEKPEVNQESSKEKADTVKVEKKEVETAPVYTKEDEQPVKVKFFVVELWDKLFH